MDKYHHYIYAYMCAWIDYETSAIQSWHLALERRTMKQYVSCIELSSFGGNELESVVWDIAICCKVSH